MLYFLGAKLRGAYYEAVKAEWRLCNKGQSPVIAVVAMTGLWSRGGR